MSNPIPNKMDADGNPIRISGEVIAYGTSSFSVDPKETPTATDQTEANSYWYVVLGSDGRTYRDSDNNLHTICKEGNEAVRGASSGVLSAMTLVSRTKCATISKAYADGFRQPKDKEMLVRSCGYGDDLFAVGLEAVKAGALEGRTVTFVPAKDGQYDVALSVRFGGSGVFEHTVVPEARVRLAAMDGITLSEPEAKPAGNSLETAPTTPF